MRLCMLYVGASACRHNCNEHRHKSQVPLLYLLCRVPHIFSPITFKIKRRKHEVDLCCRLSHPPCGPFARMQ